ncbi:STT3 domain-containing protein [Persephonella sp.]
MKFIKKVEGFIWFFPILTVSLLFKFRDLRFFSTDNFLSCHDCHWFARLSEDFLNSKFSNIDYLSNVPDYMVVPLSLIVVFPAVVSKLTGIELNKIFLYAPPVMGTLFVIPMFYWIRQFAPVHVFVGASFLGLFNYVYYYRTSLGRYDTDFLILFFVFLILFLISKSVFNKEKSYLYIILAGIFSQIFMWWYYTPILLIFFAAGILLGLIVQREKLSEILKKVTFFLLLCNPVYVYEGLNSFVRYFLGFFIKKPEGFPVNLSSFIIELAPVDFNRFLSMTVDHTGILILSVIGFVLLFVKKFRYMIIALPFIVVGLTVFTAGERFLMYLAPFLGMGVGYVMYLMNSYLKKVILNQYAFKFITVLFILMTGFFSTNSNALVFSAKPSINENYKSALQDLDKKLEKDAYIWQWWDYGSVLEYYLRRGTYIDNHSFHPLKLYAYSFSMMEYDEKKSRNIIAFVTNNLSLSYTPQVLTKDVFISFIREASNYDQPLKNNVYIFVYPSDILKDVIIAYGVVGAKQYVGELYLGRAFYKCMDDEQFFNCGRFEIHKFLQIFNWKDESYLQDNPYYQVIYTDLSNDKDMFRKVLFENSDSKKRLILQFIRRNDDMYVYIYDKKFLKSIFVRMVSGSSFKCFDLLYNRFPTLMVYKVNPDKNCQ